MKQSGANPRRDFLRKAGATLSVSTLFPTIWVRKGFAARKDIVLGHNSHRYRVVEGWTRAKAH